LNTELEKTGCAPEQVVEIRECRTAYRSTAPPTMGLNADLSPVRCAVKELRTKANDLTGDANLVATKSASLANWLADRARSRSVSR
jgi:hypothetical protein